MRITLFLQHFVHRCMCKYTTRTFNQSCICTPVQSSCMNIKRCYTPEYEQCNKHMHVLELKQHCPGYQCRNSIFINRNESNSERQHCLSSLELKISKLTCKTVHSSNTYMHIYTEKLQNLFSKTNLRVFHSTCPQIVVKKAPET